MIALGIFVAFENHKNLIRIRIHARNPGSNGLNAVSVEVDLPTSPFSGIINDSCDILSNSFYHKCV